MKNTAKKVLSVLLCLITIFSIMSVTAVPVEAAEDGISIRINALKTKFPHGKFWNHYVTKPSEAGLSASKNEAFANSVTSHCCASHSANAKVGQYECNYFDGGVQCWGFAVKFFYDVFGVRASKMAKRTDTKNIKVGDYLRFGTDSDGHSAVVIARSGNTLTLVEGNFRPTGSTKEFCHINWGRKVNVNTVSYYKRASNYDNVKNDVNRTLDVNISVDGTAFNSGHNNVTFDVYIGSKLVADDVKDFKAEYAHNSAYTINDIRVTGCFVRANENVISGKLSANTTITIPITEKHNPTPIPAIPAKCTETGMTEGSKCADCEKVLLAPTATNELGHSIIETVIPATCKDIEKMKYTCSRCDYEKISTSPSLFTAWSLEAPPKDAVVVETKTQYRSTDRAQEWTVSETGTIDYAVSWPAGFNKSDSLYTKYNKKPVAPSESDTAKTEVTTTDIGYIYWHWCRGDYTSGPINRKIGDAKSSTYDTFHAFVSTTDAATVTESNARKYSNKSACTDSFWWVISRVQLKRCTYTSYVRTDTDGWSEWTDWQDEEITPSGNKKVETRTLYRWVENKDGLYASHKWGDWKYTAFSCNAEKLCSVCNEKETKTIKLLGDSDFNGKITAADARIALRASVNLEKSTAELLEVADIDKDGKLAASDARLILRASVGLETLCKDKKH